MGVSPNRRRDGATAPSSSGVVGPGPPCRLRFVIGIAHAHSRDGHTKKALLRESNREDRVFGYRSRSGLSPHPIHSRGQGSAEVPPGTIRPSHDYNGNITILLERIPPLGGCRLITRDENHWGTSDPKPSLASHQPPHHQIRDGDSMLRKPFFSAVNSQSPLR